MRFAIEVDMNRWLRGSQANRDRIIRTRKESSFAIALLIEQLAKENIVSANINDTGELANSIIAVPTGTGATVLVTAPYAWYVEYGTGIYNTAGLGRRTSWVYFNRSLGKVVRTRGRRATPYFMSATIQAELLASKVMTGIFNTR
jgi:hypothetical protein